MSLDVTGIPTRAGRAGTSTGGTSPVPPSPSAPSRALTRVDPSASATGTRAAATDTGTIANPLDRSGLSLREVLGTSDEHIVRERAAPVALEVGLETARSALLRQQPVDALAALDSVWEGARQTEDGWYLRGGALLVLGLPGEGDRVAEEGIAARPASTALRFLQSLARLTLGDLHGARTTLGMALQRLPSDRLLRAQQAVLLAQAGDDEGADAAMRAASKRAAPGDPVLAYGYAAMRAASVERRRSAGGIDVPDAAAAHGELHPATTDALDSPLGMQGAIEELSETTPERVARSAAFEPEVATTRDPVFAAVQSLGTRLAVSEVDALAREVRLLLRALSAGGTLANSARPELSHAARGILSVMLDVLDRFGQPGLRPSSIDAPDAPAFAALVRDVVTAARDGKPDEALRTLRRHPALARESVGALLQSMVSGALHRRAAGDPASGQPGGVGARNDADPAHGFIAESPRGVRGDTIDRMHGDGYGSAHGAVEEEQGGPIIPVRLGLRLIDESAASRALLRVSAETGSDVRVLLSSAGGSGLAAAIAAARSSVRWDAGVTASDAPDVRRDAARDAARESQHAAVGEGGQGLVTMAASRAPGLPDGVDTMNMVEPADAAIASGWLAGTTLQSRPAGVRTDEDEAMIEGRGARMLAMLCVLVAAMAAASGYTAAAVAFGVGASWFALRHSGGGTNAVSEDEQADSRSSGERRH